MHNDVIMICRPIFIVATSIRQWFVGRLIAVVVSFFVAVFVFLRAVFVSVCTISIALKSKLKLKSNSHRWNWPPKVSYWFVLDKISFAGSMLTFDNITISCLVLRFNIPGMMIGNTIVERVFGMILRKQNGIEKQYASHWNRIIISMFYKPIKCRPTVFYSSIEMFCVEKTSFVSFVSFVRCELRNEFRNGQWHTNYKVLLISQNYANQITNEIEEKKIGQLLQQ